MLRARTSSVGPAPESFNLSGTDRSGLIRALGLGGLAGNLGGGLVGQFLSWRAPFGVTVPLAALLALAATAVLIVGHRDRKTTTRTIASDEKRVLSRPTRHP